MVRIAVLASFNLDLVMRTRRRPASGETLQGEFAMHLGGKGFNQAVAARRLGADVAVMGRVGDDEFGRLFLAALDRQGIDRRAVSVDPHAGTGVASIIVEPDGTNTIVQSPRANRNVTPGDIARSARILDGTDASLLQLETSIEAALAFASLSRSRGVPAMINFAPIIEFPPALLELADTIVVNKGEAQAIAGTDDQDADALTLALRGTNERAAVVITMGEDGAIAADDQIVIRQSALNVAVIDSVGAGDAFCAALAVRTAEGAGLAEAVWFANAAGALACTRAGAEPSMPRRDEVEKLLATGVTR